MTSSVNAVASDVAAPVDPGAALEAFFRPRRIAVIGASGDLNKMASRPLVYLRESGFAGEVYPVNPKYQELLGYPCLPDIEHLPHGVDLALIALPASAVPNAVRRCGARGVRAVTILSGGFSELGSEGGRQVEAALLAAIQETGIRVCGPNCQGGINLFDKVTASYSGALASGTFNAGPVGLITQSGVFGGLVFAAAQEEGIGVGFWASTGNELDLKFADYLDYIAHDSRVRVVGGYIESIKGEGARFIAALQRARRSGKPVVLLKTGRTEAGRAAAASHTAALAGSDEGYNAAFLRGGAVRVDSAQEFREVVAAFAAGRMPRGRRVAILSISGGAATLMADDCCLRGLEVAGFSEGLQQRLAKVVPEFGSVANPVDLTGQLVADAGLLERSGKLILDSGEADVLTVFIGMCERNRDALVEALASLARASDIPILVTWVAGHASVYRRLRELGLPVFTDSTACINALARMVQWVETSVPDSRSDFAAGASTFAAQASDLRGSLTEAAAKRVLANLGLPVPRGRMVTTADAAVATTRDLGGDVVMKVQAPSVPHKSDIGGVRVGVTVQRAREEFLALQRLLPADGEGVLIEERIPGSTECFVGVQRHPIFGSMIAVGIGGIFLETLRDVAIRIAPLDAAEAVRMIRSLKGFPTLAGARGQPPRDVAALADLVARVSQLAVAAGDNIVEMDLNPVFVGTEGRGVVIGDALIIGRQ